MFYIAVLEDGLPKKETYVWVSYCFKLLTKTCKFKAEKVHLWWIITQWCAINFPQIQQFSKKEIEDLLRKGAYAAIMDENDEGSRFCEEDIDQILQRRATTITIESEGKGSTFSKASFVASENRTDIALDDPEFWQKWAKKADIDMDTFNRKVQCSFFQNVATVSFILCQYFLS